MNPKEQEIAIGELEERVDRLRNLYEQYFLGFEKLEPTVPRKDVDRRLALLRKEQIRNTAMRFRLQVVTQKYTTYAMHWVRICRQIEEGTYKRHIHKAKARFGDSAQPRERDIPIDISIDIDDFDDIDVNEAIAQAGASGDAQAALPPTSQQRASVRDSVRDSVRAPKPASVAVAGPREVIDDLEPPTPPVPSMRAGPERTARGAALPIGAKPAILRKRGELDSSPRLSSHSNSLAAPPPPQSAAPEAPPAQPRSIPASAPLGLPSHRPLPGAPRPAPQLRPLNPASAVRGPTPSSPGIDPPSAPATRPTGPRIAPAASAGRIAAAPPNAGVPAAGRTPIAEPPRPGLVSGSTKAAPRPPMPSVTDSAGPASGSGAPTVRRPSLPLPSQVNRPAKPANKE